MPNQHTVRPISPARRFWEKVDTSGECWRWLGSHRGAYGIFWYEGRLVPAHRWAYEQVNGPLADGFEPDHLCRQPNCVRASHIEPVDHRTNMLRGVSPTAVNARRTHCVNGHPFDLLNTRVKNGERRCLECKRLTNLRRVRGKARAALAQE